MRGDAVVGAGVVLETPPMGWPRINVLGVG